MQLHPIQLRILFDLLFEKSLKYSEIKPVYMENSQFVFHMNRLAEMDLVSKWGSTYKLTEKGKEFANKIDVETLKIRPQAKITTELCAVRNLGSEVEFLVYKRLKNPFYGTYGFPTQKVFWGESIEEAAKRGLMEETGLEGTPKLFAVRHYRVYSSKEELLEDKLMHGFIFENPTGKLSSSNEGEYFWIKEKEIEKKITKPQDEFYEFLNTLKSLKNEITYKEIEVITKNF